MPSVTASSAGQSVSVTYTAPVSPTGPNLPIVDFSSLNPVPGETFAATLSRLTSPARVRLPAGTFYVSDFKQGYYDSLFNSNVLGFEGAGIDQTIIELTPNSSTQASVVPAQSSGQTNPLAMMLVGQGSSSNRRQTYHNNYTLIGTTQPASPNNPTLPGHAFGGLRNEYGNGSVISNMKFVAASYGDWNSPPGETFQINNYHDTGTIIQNVEVSGLNLQGQKVGGSPMGANQSTNITIIGGYFHDSYVSGPTFSFTGTPSVANATNGVHSIGWKVAHNANTSPSNGKAFPGVNHEHVLGTILHENIDIQIDNPTWVSGHMSFVNTLQDNPDITIVEPVWHEGAPMFNGCFMVRILPAFNGVANKQVTPPKVIKNGVQLTPVYVSAYSNTPVNADPTKNYVINTSA